MLLSFPLKLLLDLRNILVRIARVSARLGFGEIFEEVDELLVLLGQEVHKDAIGREILRHQLIRLFRECQSSSHSFRDRHRNLGKIELKQG